MRVLLATVKNPCIPPEYTGERIVVEPLQGLPISMGENGLNFCLDAKDYKPIKVLYDSESFTDEELDPTLQGDDTKAAMGSLERLLGQPMASITIDFATGGDS